MRFRLTAELPREIDFGSGCYVLELVDADPGDGCWLRARACDEPTVFLLAHFTDRSDAVSTLLDECDVSECPVHRRLIKRLAEQGAAEVVRRQVPAFVLSPQPRWTPDTARVLELAEA